MDNSIRILSSIPLFRHLNTAELGLLFSIAGFSAVKSGSGFNLAKTGTFNVVISGLLEIESSGRTDIVYMAPGSFFGHIPFTLNRHRGNVKALTDSTLLVFKPEDIYRYFLSYFQAFRGYVSILEKLNFELPAGGQKRKAAGAKVICFYSIEEGAGKSTAASIFSAAASLKGRTVLLDLSYKGRSVFDNFNANITSPLSYRDPEQAISEESVMDRIVAAASGPDLMNVANGSRIRVAPELLSPLIYILAGLYDNIVIDLDSTDPDLASASYAISDFMVCVVKDVSAIRSYYSYNDSCLSGIRTVVYLINEKFSGKFSRRNDAYILENIEGAADIPDNAESCMALVKPLADRIFRRRRALVIESGWRQAVMSCGIFGALHEKPDMFDIIYTSTLSYLTAAVFLKTSSADEYKNIILKLLGDKKISSLFSFIFPEKNIFSSDPLRKISRDFFSDLRSDSFRVDTPLKITPDDKGGSVIIPSGQISDLMPAALSLRPLFESVRLNGEYYNSGYPGAMVKVEELYRSSVDETVYLSAVNQFPCASIPGIPPVFLSFLDIAEGAYINVNDVDMYDHLIDLKFSEKELNIEKMFNHSYDLSIKCLKENGLL
jgi:MinD-like ATPase involved in chromosome partitioning or flagellar assembly